MNTSTELPGGFLSSLANICQAADLLTDPTECWPYGYDNSRRHALPAAVVFPRSHEQVCAIVKLCYNEHVNIVPRGRGTGTTGATVPLDNAIVMSLERMSRILDIDVDNRYIKVEPGVSNEEVQLAAKEHGFFWPPDPTSAAVCTIGGNLAYNSAGPRAVKYGTPRENTLALTAVTGTGDTIRTGTRTSKGVVGYDLTRLLIGSEGTLAVITEATLKLTPLAECKTTMQAVYRDIDSAARAVSAIMSQAVTPCALEFIDQNAIEMVRDYSDIALPENAGAMLMIEVDGPASAMPDSVLKLKTTASNDGLVEFTIAEDAADTAALWATRKALSPALRNIAPKKINEDVVVPVSRLPELINGLDALSQQHGIRIVNFGHAGNGNIHTNLLVNPDDPDEMAAAERCLDDVFSLVLKLDGSLSGEHGVGIEKRDFVKRELDPVSISLMHQIKQQFDPANILNPGKTLPLSD